MKYRKKPVVIEAVQFTAESFWDCHDNNKLIFGRFSPSGEYHPKNRTISVAYLHIDTIEGRMRADLGDWIIKGIKGEFYPCKPDIFEATYEPVEESPAKELR